MTRRRESRQSPKREEKQDWVVNYILIISSLVWVANFIFGIVIDSYEGSETINAIFVAVIGGVFTLKGQRKNADD